MPCLVDHTYSKFPISFIGSGKFHNPLKVVSFIFVRTFGQTGNFQIGTTQGGQDVLPAVSITDNYVANLDWNGGDLYFTFSGVNRILIYCYILNIV